LPKKHPRDEEGTSTRADEGHKTLATCYISIIIIATPLNRFKVGKEARVERGTGGESERSGLLRGVSHAIKRE
jgi:hypothetical protein